MPYLLTPLAQEDYESLLYKLAERWHMALEHRVGRKAPRRLRLLAANPGLGHLREDLVPRSIYFHNVDRYQVLYLRDTEPLKIIAVLHNARDIGTLMRDR